MQVSASLPSALVAASAMVIFLLGAVHLLYTFRGDKLHPRGPALRIGLEQTPFVLTRQTTLWRAWIGFNASHSCGALLFGAIYGYLSLVRADVLFQSWFLRGVGLLMLVGYAILGKRYWFSVPLHGVLLSLAFYVCALVVAGARG